MADLTDELAGLNENARLLLEKYDGVFAQLDEQSKQALIDIANKSDEGLQAIQTFLDNGSVAEAENALKLGGKTQEEITKKQVLVFGLSSNSGATNGVTVKVPFDNKIDDTFETSLFDSDNKRFVVKDTGTYYIKASVRTNCGGSTPRVDLAIFKNGEAYIANGFNQDSGGCGNWGVMVDSIIHLEAGDYIEIYYNQNSGDDLTIYGTDSGGTGNTGGIVTYINIARLGE